MSTRVMLAAVAAATLALVLAPGTALANKPVYAVSGQVTTPPTGQQITVNGRTYAIEPGSPAAAQVNEVVQGERVQVTLSGPAGSSSSNAVAIHEPSGR